MHGSGALTTRLTARKVFLWIMYVTFPYQLVALALLGPLLSYNG